MYQIYFLFENDNFVIYLTLEISFWDLRLFFSKAKEDGYFDPLELAAAIEAKSTHPLADAIVSGRNGNFINSKRSVFIEINDCG